MADDIGESTTDNSLRGKKFDEVCILLEPDEGVKGFVYFKPAEGGKWQHCFAFMPNEYTEDELIATINSEFGPGEYPVQFKQPDEKGRPVNRWQENLIVKARRMSAPTPAATPATSSGDPMMAAAIENQTRIFSTLVEKLSSAPAPVAPPSTIEVAKDLAALKDLFQPEKTSPLESIKEMLEVMALLQNSQGGGGDPWTTALEKLLPAITKGSEELSRREIPKLDNTVAAPVRAPQPAVVDQPRPEVAAVQPEAVHVEQAFVHFMANYLPNALQLADAGTPPRQVAEYIARVAGASAPMLDIVGRVIAQDDMVERLAVGNPAVFVHADWFDEVGDWLAHALWPETNPPPGASGATIDATIDVKVAPHDIKPANDGTGEGDDDVGPQVALDADGKPINDANTNTSGPSRNDET